MFASYILCIYYVIIKCIEWGRPGTEAQAIVYSFISNVRPHEVKGVMVEKKRFEKDGWPGLFMELLEEHVILCVA